MELRVGDYGYDITFNVKQSDGSTIQDLTGVTEIKFQVVTIDTFRNIVNGDCVIITPAAGTCKYTVQSGDFPTAGNYKGILRLTYATPKQVSTREIYLTILKKLA